jgi:hypothetical protein
MAEALSTSRILKVQASHPKVQVMLWSLLMLSTVATTAAVGCQAGGEPVIMSE